jgi:hypothetical protein
MTNSNRDEDNCAALTLRPRAPRWIRYGWALVVTLASIGGWVVDHCADDGQTGAVLRMLWGVRHPAPAPSIKAPASQPRGPGAG